MRSTAKIALVIACLGLLTAGAPLSFAQGFPKAAVRLCLRNLLTGIGCYVIGRAGELIIDGSLTAAWAMAKEKATGKEPNDAKKATQEPDKPAIDRSKALAPFTNPVIEPIDPSDLDSLAKKLPKDARPAPSTTLSEGFLIYEAPPGLPKPRYRAILNGIDPNNPPKDNPLIPPPLMQDGGATGHAKKPAPPAEGKSKAAQVLESLAPKQVECHHERADKLNLKVSQLVGKSDFEARFNRRIEKVVKPCMQLVP